MSRLHTAYTWCASPLPIGQHRSPIELKITYRSSSNFIFLYQNTFGSQLTQALDSNNKQKHFLFHYDIQVVAGNVVSDIIGTLICRGLLSLFHYMKIVLYFTRMGEEKRNIYISAYLLYFTNECKIFYAKVGFAAQLSISLQY